MAKTGKEKLKESIIQLAESDTGRSATARLADIIDEVEQALRKGVKRQAIIEQLKTTGLHFTLGSFDIARRRIRNRSARSPKRAPKVQSIPEKPTAAPAVAAAPIKEPGVAQSGSKKFVYDSSVNNDDVI